MSLLVRIGLIRISPGIKPAHFLFQGE